MDPDRLSCRQIRARQAISLHTAVSVVQTCVACIVCMDGERSRVVFISLSAHTSTYEQLMAAELVAARARAARGRGCRQGLHTYGQHEAGGNLTRTTRQAVI